MRNAVLYIEDLLGAMTAIEKFVVGMTFEDFRSDDKTSSAVIRKFEIIGEATKNLPDTLIQNYPEVPWKEMAGMRDKLIHFYFGIKYELVWRTIKDVIPHIKPRIDEVLRDLKDER